MTAVSQRSDARRNRAGVLAAAREVFATDGLDLSLARVARQAGVGAGTVYRHFPTRESLLDAVLAEHTERLVTRAAVRTGSEPPGAALFGLLTDVILASAGRKPLCDAFVADRRWPHAALIAAARRFDDALDRLLLAAQAAGDVRADIDLEDVHALVVGGAALYAAHTDGRRMVGLLLDTLRGGDVTKASVDFRDAGERGCHGTPLPDRTPCPECGTEFRRARSGRPARYCGSTCRQRAHRRRAG